MKIHKHAILVSALALFLGACTHTAMTDQEGGSEPNNAGSESGAEQSTMNEMPVGSEDPAVSQMVDGTEQAVDYTIDMQNYSYSLESIEAAPGETITLELTNSQGMHDFLIDELDVNSGMVSEGDSAVVSIQVPEDAQVGTEYSYYCSVGNHRALGMEGTLTVVQR